MDRTNSHSESCRPFLQPPHRHDPTSVSLLSTLPPQLMKQFPASVQTALQDLQESTCVAYASFERLEDLIDERFERLMPSMGPDGPTFSESSWFNYSNQYQAEQDYLLSEALPDWHCKANITQRALLPHLNTPMPTTTPNDPKYVADWWNAVRACLSTWLERSKRFDLPDFEEVVEDYLSGRNDAAIYETPELSPVTVQQSKLHQQQALVKEAYPEIQSRSTNERCIPLQPLPRDIGLAAKPVDLRKDSGISMVAG